MNREEKPCRKAVKVWIDGVEYPSKNAAAVFLGTDATSFGKMTKKFPQGFVFDGFTVRFEPPEIEILPLYKFGYIHEPEPKLEPEPVPAPPPAARSYKTSGPLLRYPPGCRPIDRGIPQVRR